MTKPCVWEELVGQRQVADHLAAAVRRGAVSHAYLFVGPAGAGKKSSARALACAILCDDDACGVCPTCRRVKRGAHPDVRVIAPEGAATYMVEQVREIIHDVHLSPIEADCKIYIVEAADSFNDGPANAFLKTLEEPPEDVIMILLATTYDARAADDRIPLSGRAFPQDGSGRSPSVCSSNAPERARTSACSARGYRWRPRAG
jgi:DNA polymerase III subunit delta'